MAVGTQGTQIELTPKPGGVPGTPVMIAQATGWNGPRFTRNEIDTTSLISTAKEYILGLKDPGEYSIDVNYDLSDPGQAFAWDQLNENEPFGVEVTFPDGGGGYTFDALVMNFENTGRADDKVSGTLTLRITGDVGTIAPTTARKEKVQRQDAARREKRAKVTA
jgi:Lambda phage tail tube protein, TTP